VPAHIAPADAAGTVFNLPAGEMVQARESHSGFTLIRTRDGRAGWVKDTSVARVI